MAVAFFSELELCSRRRGITGTLHYCNAVIQLNYLSEQRLFDNIPICQLALARGSLCGASITGV